jgi:hypothetical protein
LFTSNVGGLSSYDRVFLTDEKWFVSTNGYSWLGSDNAIPGECVTLGRGLVNQQVTPLVEVSDPFFVT